MKSANVPGRLVPGGVDVPEDLTLRGGLDAYRVDRGRALAGTTVGISAVDLVEDEGFLHELAAFTDRTGIAVELTPVEAQGRR